MWRLKRAVHVSWLVAVLCVGFLVGVYLAASMQVAGASWVWLASAFILLTVGLIKRIWVIIPLVLVAGVLIGLVRGSLAADDLQKTQIYYGMEVEVEGTVKEDADVGASGQMVLRLANITINNQDMPGVVWVSVSPADIKRGDIVTVFGKLDEGFGSFVGSMYRAGVREIVQPKPGDVARVVRDWFADATREFIPEPHASLGIGYLVGQRRALPMELGEALQIAGLTHVVVASGYNLTILVRFSRRFLVQKSKYLSTAVSGAMVVCFIAVTGISPSMSRAGLVAGLSLLAWYYGRCFHPLVLLPLAAAVTVAINPGYIWGDIGWQLSFAAFAGVMILAPLLQRFFFGETKPGTVRQILGETISAQIATAPILIAAFGQFSNVAIIANLLVLPLVPLAMLLTFVAGVASLALPAWGAFVGLPATWLLGYMVEVAQTVSELSWALMEIEVGWQFVAGAYMVLALVCFYLSKTTKYRLREVNIVE